MTTLANHRHELFAQELAKGATQLEAYATAGYKAHESNAHRLSENDKVSQRVAELLGQAASRTVVTVASLTDRLLAIATKGEGAADAPLLAVARAALMDAAKLNGLIVDKTDASVKQTTHLIADRPVTPAEWADEHVPPEVMQ